MSASIEKCLAFADNDVCDVCGTRAVVLPFVVNNDDGNDDDDNEFSFTDEFVAEFEWFW